MSTTPSCVGARLTKNRLAWALIFQRGLLFLIAIVTRILYTTFTAMLKTCGAFFLKFQS